MEDFVFRPGEISHAECFGRVRSHEEARLEVDYEVQAYRDRSSNMATGSGSTALITSVTEESLSNE